MGNIKILVGLFLALSAAPAMADQCLDQNLIASIQAKITLQTSDLSSFDRCKADTNTYKVLQALTLIETIQFQQGALATPFNQDILPTDFWGYFSGRVNTVQDEPSCQSGVLAFVYGYFNDGVVHLCPLIYDQRISLSERAETMLHEARHFEGYAHVTCIVGPRKGMAGACDDSAGQKGSYAVTVESLTKMALLGKDFSPIDKALTKISALSYANEVFNQPIVPYQMASVYLASNSRDAYFYDESDGSLRQAPPVDVAHVKLISRGPSLTVYPTDKSDAYTLDTFSSAFHMLDPIGSAAIGYNQTDKALRPDVVDVINADYISVSATRTHISGSLRGDTVDTNIDLPWNAKQMFTSPEVGETNEDSVYLVSDTDRMYRVKFLPNQQYSITEVPNLAKGFRSLLVLNGQRLGLSEKGQVLTNQNGKWISFAPLQGKQFATMTRPFLWSSYFEEIQ